MIYREPNRFKHLFTKSIAAKRKYSSARRSVRDFAYIKSQPNALQSECRIRKTASITPTVEAKDRFPGAKRRYSDKMMDADSARRIRVARPYHVNLVEICVKIGGTWDGPTIIGSNKRRRFGALEYG
jgi:hypothetical protein